MSHERIRAVLFNAVKEGDRISGNCYCDRENEFYDGEIITTSPVLEIITSLGMTGSLAVTRNSIYKIANWAMEGRKQ